jgi:DNA-binding MarR family transcriptional regulator
MGKIAGEIKQTRPFKSLEAEAVVTLLRTSDVLRAQVEAALKPWGLSAEQYNILRILRGAPDHAHPTLEIAGRMISRAPNITRLIDKLIHKGLVFRRPSPDDRRVVEVRLTPRGLRTVIEATPVLDALDEKLLRCLSDARLKVLIRGLDEVRASALHNAGHDE